MRGKWRKYRKPFLLCSLSLSFVISIHLDLLLLNYHPQLQSRISKPNQTYTLIRNWSRESSYTFPLISWILFEIISHRRHCSKKDFRFVMNNNICRDYDVRMIVIVSSAVQNKVFSL